MHRFMMALTLAWVVVCATPRVAESEQLDALAVVVGTGAVTCYEVQQAVDTMIRQMRLSGAAVPPRSEVEKRVLRSKVDEQLQLQRAKQLKLSVSDEEINQAMAAVERDNGIPAGKLDS
ncbi:MAG: SurA N-terminal domain-containing protein, partial [Mariprofundales bacterium]|nr:SurA N-terminal domain-containing protein [Mariprofundales bacterium]